MLRSPRVGVVLPSYNHAPFVAAAVESVLNQTITDIELIVVDDGSTDGTPDIVANIQDPRLRLIRLGQNRLRHPRNLALGLTRAPNIAFQNSDDLWLPEKLETQLALLEERGDVVACFTDVEIIGHDDSVLSASWANGLFSTENRTHLRWMRHFFDVGNCLCLTSGMVRRSAMEMAGVFRGQYIQLSDLDLWTRLAALGQFHIVDKRLTRFRVVTGSKGHENLSGPQIASQNRSVIEHADLLHNFLAPPILDMLPDIFPDVVGSAADSPPVRVARLARYAWSLGTAQHSLFADRAVASVMADERARNDVADVLGAEIFLDFVRRRGDLSIRPQAQLLGLAEPATERDPALAGLRAQLAERDRLIQDLSVQLAAEQNTVSTLVNSRSWKMTLPLRAIANEVSRLWRRK
jgi:glycosyltransferase involved in cell wall biosynthesis